MSSALLPVLFQASHRHRRRAGQDDGTSHRYDRGLRGRPRAATNHPSTLSLGGAMRAKKVRVGIVGVGNCASSLVQGLSYYRDASGNAPVPGLMKVDLGGYHVRDVEVASAFDVAAGKVGRDVVEAILAEPNNTVSFDKVDP